MSATAIGKCLTRKCRESESLLLAVVTIGAFLDSMLITTVVPIFPDHLQQMSLSNETESNVTQNFSINSTENNFVQMTNASSVQLNATQLALNRTSAKKNDTEMAKEGLELGLLFASKPCVQLLVNPLVGRFANRFSYRKMMSLGFAIMFSSTLLFAMGERYLILLFARSLQGAASSFTSVVGITALADRFTEEGQRQNAIRVALVGLGIGLSVGPPFGGYTYQYLGKTAPFLILCGLIFFDTCLLALTAQPASVKKKKEIQQSSYMKLIKDPYIMIVTGGVFLTCASYAVIEAILPLHMKRIMDSTSSELGLVFIPYSVCFLVVTAVIGHICLRVERWLISIVGVLITAVSLIMFPFCKNIWQLFIPSAMMGTGGGVVDIALMPEIAHLVDIRHTSVYGNAFAIVDTAMCLGLTIGPTLAGSLLQCFNFVTIMVGGSMICFMYVPLIYLLRSPPVKNVTQPPPTEIQLFEISLDNDKVESNLA